MLSQDQTIDESLNQSFLVQGLEYQEYFLINNNIIYKLEIKKRKKEIIINYKNYAINFNYSDFEALTSKKFKSMEEVYTYIINVFDEGNVKIKYILNKKEMILILETCNKNIEMILSYNESNKSISIINELYDNYNELKNEIDNLKKEIHKYKKENNENFQIFNEVNPKEIQYPINLT